MDFNNINELKKFGFSGFITIQSLWSDKKMIPKQKGVYLVLNPVYDKPVKFLNPGVGGFFKGKDPNVSVEEIKQNYVTDSFVVYVGKAGGPKVKATLFSRLGQYLRFGQGKNVGHWGGRFIWQLANHEDLVICWKPIPNEDPREVEKDLIHEYFEHFGMRPFANLTD